MERKSFLKAIAFASIAPAVLLAACAETGEKKHAGEKKQTFTCPMHPQIVQDKPGTCPICGMDLVPVDKSSEDISITLDESQIQLANITTAAVSTGALSNFKRLNGRLATDPEKNVIISSRVPGRIEVLFVKETGVKVSKGQPLYKIYSEQLASLQQECLLTTAQARQFPGDARFEQIRQAARQKLVLYGQSDVEIDRLVRSGKVEPYVTYSAPAGGTVSKVTVTEGQYVSEGGPVMRLEDYGQLWVEADVYPAEAAAVRVGQTVEVVVPGWENERQKMTVRFINPSLQSGSQLLQVRGAVANPENRWRPGMQATILLPVQSKGSVPSLPVDAVIRDGKGAHVWIEKERGKFVPRMVKTGMEDVELVEITSGLQAGEKVVITGAYLLYSEFILKKGSDPLAGMTGIKKNTH